MHRFLRWRNLDLLSSSVILVFGMLMVALSAGMPWMYGRALGPGFLPSVVSGLLSLCALGQLLTDVKLARKDVRGKQGDGEPPARTAWLLTGCFAAYVLLVSWVGLFVSTVLFCCVLVRLLSPQPWPRTIGLSVAVAAGASVTFEYLFKLPLPHGFFVF